jgi:hypothetical protein
MVVCFGALKRTTVPKLKQVRTLCALRLGFDVCVQRLASDSELLSEFRLDLTSRCTLPKLFCPSHTQCGLTTAIGSLGLSYTDAERPRQFCTK